VGQGVGLSSNPSTAKRKNKKTQSEQINAGSKVVDHKINTQKSVMFLCTINEQSKMKLRK
jgi:hypothetical protein